MIHAAQCGYNDLLEYLLRNGALVAPDYNYLSPVPVSEWYTPLEVVMRSSRHDIVRLVLGLNWTRCGVMTAGFLGDMDTLDMMLDRIPDIIELVGGGDYPQFHIPGPYTYA